jgi:hypothetical protein
VHEKARDQRVGYLRRAFKGCRGEIEGDLLRIGHKTNPLLSIETEWEKASAAPLGGRAVHEKARVQNTGYSQGHSLLVVAMGDPSVTMAATATALAATTATLIEVG